MGLGKTIAYGLSPMTFGGSVAVYKGVKKAFPSTGDAMAKGGATGAAAGASAGPYGALIGGLVGAGMGGYSKYQSNERDKKQRVLDAYDTAAQDDEMTKGAFERQRQQEEILKSIMMEG